MEKSYVAIFVLAGNQAGWIQVTSSNQASVGYELNVHSTFKAFAELSSSVWHECYPVASIGPGQRFTSVHFSKFWYAI